MLGAELTKLDEWTLSLLTNREILAMSAPEYRPRQLLRDEKQAVWTARRESGGSFYAALFNLADEDAVVSAELSELNVDNAAGKELWTGEAVCVRDGVISAALAPRACAVYRLMP